MTRIEKVVKEISDLRDFYSCIQKRKSYPVEAVPSKEVPLPAIWPIRIVTAKK